MLSEEIKQAILTLQSQYPEKRSALLPALHLAQEEVGYLPYEVQAEVAALFEVDVNDVNGVVSFYDMFYERPVGKHIIHVCKNVSCMLRGGDGLMARLCQKLQAAPGETTSDGAFTIIASECLAACDRAPVMIVDDKVVGPVKEEEIEELLQSAKEGPGHPSPISISEVEHA